MTDRIPKEEWEKCPNCDDTGSYAVHVCDGSEEACKQVRPGQQQCKFCWTNPRSIYFQTYLVKDKE